MCSFETGPCHLETEFPISHLETEFPISLGQVFLFNSSSLSLCGVMSSGSSSLGIFDFRVVLCPIIDTYVRAPVRLCCRVDRVHRCRRARGYC